MEHLNRYTDLTPNQLVALRGDLRDLHPAMRDAFLRDGLVAQENGRLVLTDHGAAVLARAEALMSGRSPEPPLIIVQGDSHRLRPDRRRGLNAVALKALLSLARFPGQSWRWMCSTFGANTIQSLLRAGYISGAERRGAPLHLTEEGLAVLKEALQRSNVEYLEQQRLGGKQ